MQGLGFRGLYWIMQGRSSVIAGYVRLYRVIEGVTCGYLKLHRVSPGFYTLGYR